jgi:hypothetical protein
MSLCVCPRVCLCVYVCGCTCLSLSLFVRVLASFSLSVCWVGGPCSPVTNEHLKIYELQQAREATIQQERAAKDSAAASSSGRYAPPLSRCPAMYARVCAFAYACARVPVPVPVPPPVPVCLRQCDSGWGCG